MNYIIHTHIAFVFECEPTSLPPAVEMRGALSEESAISGAALLRRPEPLETLLDDRRILPVVIGVHLHVGGGYVHLIAALLDAVIVRLFFIVRAIRVTIRAIVQRAVPHEAVLEAFVALLVPLKVPDHLLLLEEHARVTVETVEVLPVVEVLAVRAAALDARRELLDVFRVVHLRLRFERGVRLAGLLGGRRGRRRRQGLRHHRCKINKQPISFLRNRTRALFPENTINQSVPSYRKSQLPHGGGSRAAGRAGVADARGSNNIPINIAVKRTITPDGI